MEITFYEVPGLDRDNILYFADKNAMDSFFSSKYHGAINLTFFPPRYTNSIRIEYEDIDLDDNVNYLSFEFRGRTYYYYIESVTYINEDVYEINITLDTITTYYFDIYFNDGILERAHVDRWDGPDINRNYIRENLSAGLFEYRNKRYITKSTDTKWLVIKSTGKQRIGVSTPLHDYIVTADGNNIVPHAYGYYVGPIDVTHDITIKYSDNQTDTLPAPHYSLLGAQGDDRTVEAFILPFSPLLGLKYDSTSHELTVPWPKAEEEGSLLPCVNRLENEVQWIGLTVGWGTLALIQYTENIQFPVTFVQNRDLAKPHSINYEPILLDENYFMLAAGTNSANTTYPLHTLITQTLTFKYSCNLDDSSCTYTLYQYDDDIFSNAVLDTNIAAMSLANSPWQSYLANIKARTLSTSLSAVSTAAEMFVGVGSEAAYASRRRDRILSNPKNFDRRYRLTNPHLKKRAAKEWAEIGDEQAWGTGGAIAKGGLSLLSNMERDISEGATALWAPAKPKQLGNALSNMSSYSFELWYQWSIVNDIEPVAEYYHRYGYLLNKYITHTNIANNLFDYFHNRHYFNYIKFTECNITLECVSESAIIGDIIDRLSDGVTMWNPDVEIGTYQYDNMEVKYE